MRAIATGALAFLCEHPAVRGSDLGAVGFSMGGAWAVFLSSRAPEAIAAVVIFYGSGGADFSTARAAYLGHYAEDDEWEPIDEVRQMEADMRAAGREVTLHTYAGVKHWFFESDRPEYDRDAAQQRPDALKRRFILQSRFTMSKDKIIIKAAREHNLKGVDLEIPRDKLVVLTGVSGSGKSSLAFDTLYAEGQRRYVESLSAYARQFLDQMEKPNVDFIQGLSPAIAIEQRSAGANPRSTIATTTEIYDYLRVLFSAVGQPHDPLTGRPLSRQTPQQIVDQILAYEAGSKIIVVAPLIENQPGEFRDVIEKLKREGFVRARIDGQLMELDRPELIRLNKNRRHTIEAVIDRLVIREGIRVRLTDSIETALKLGGNRVVVLREIGRAH